MDFYAYFEFYSNTNTNTNTFPPSKIQIQIQIQIPAALHTPNEYLYQEVMRLFSLVSPQCFSCTPFSPGIKMPSVSG